jgi:hypothetical protein
MQHDVLDMLIERERQGVFFNSCGGPFEKNVNLDPREGDWEINQNES